MTEELRQPEGEILIRLDGIFDAVAAWDVRGRLGHVAPDETVVLDFSQVKDCRDLGLAVIAQDLVPGEGPHVVLRGLCQHQHRLLKYFGVY
jgi:hypothetical protein